MMRLSLALLIAVTAPALAQGTPAGDAARGKEIYMRDACYTCHGTTGASTSFVGPKLAHSNLTPAEILRQLRHPRAQMPAYTEKVLPDGEAADVIAYIRSLPQGPAPTGKDIPQLNR